MTDELEKQIADLDEAETDYICSVCMKGPAILPNASRILEYSWCGTVFSQSHLDL